MFWITLIICAFFGWSMGRTSNGMTSPRTSFNIWIAPFGAIAGLVIAVLAGLFTGSFAIWTGVLTGAAAAAAGLIAARLTRNR